MASKEPAGIKICLLNSTTAGGGTVGPLCVRLQVLGVQADWRLIHGEPGPGERGAFGRAGREHVRQQFLLPWLVRTSCASSCRS